MQPKTIKIKTMAVAPLRVTQSMSCIFSKYRLHYILCTSFYGLYFLCNLCQTYCSIHGDLCKVFSTSKYMHLYLCISFSFCSIHLSQCRSMPFFLDLVLPILLYAYCTRDTFLSINFNVSSPMHRIKCIKCISLFNFMQSYI